MTHIVRNHFININSNAINMDEIDPYTILTEKEIEKSREAFSAFDRDNSDAIDKDELKKVLEGTNILYNSFLKLII